MSVTDYLQNVDESTLTTASPLWSTPAGKITYLHGGHTSRADRPYSIVVFVGDDGKYHASVRNSDVKCFWEVEKENPEWRAPTAKDILDKLKQEAGCSGQQLLA